MICHPCALEHDKLECAMSHWEASVGASHNKVFLMWQLWWNQQKVVFKPCDLKVIIRLFLPQEEKENKKSSTKGQAWICSFTTFSRTSYFIHCKIMTLPWFIWTLKEHGQRWAVGRCPVVNLAAQTVMDGSGRREKKQMSSWLKNGRDFGSSWKVLHCIGMPANRLVQVYLQRGTK